MLGGPKLRAKHAKPAQELAHMLAKYSPSLADEARWHACAGCVVAKDSGL